LSKAWSGQGFVALLGKFIEKKLEIEIFLKLKLTPISYFDEIAQKHRPPAAGGDSPRPPD
jgi:hypothetical protein